MTSTGVQEDEHEDEHGVTRGAVTAGGVAVLFLVLRVMAVSRWDWHTAFAVVHTIGFDDAIPIAFGTLMASHVFTSVILMWILPVSFVDFVWPLDKHPRHPSNLLLVAALIAATVALVTTFHEWWLLIGVIVIAVLLVGVRLGWRDGQVHKIVEIVLHSVGVTAVGGVLVLAAVVRTPWMPLEHIATRHGVITGYVLDAEPGFVKVLTEDERTFTILTTDNVISRQEIEH